MKERERTTNARALPFMIVVKVMVGVEGCTGVKVALTMSTGKTGAPDAKGRCCCVMAEYHLANTLCVYAMTPTSNRRMECDGQW
jgi:hypothetical protein